MPTATPFFSPRCDPLNAAIEVLIAVRKAVRNTLRVQPDKALERIEIHGPNGRTKEMLYVDKEAENQCREQLLTRLHDPEQEQYCVLGEETLWKLPDLDLSRQSVSKTGEVLDTAERRLVAILDMIDGTDLLERDLENWCSAVVFFDPRPPKPRILFSLVHDSRDRIYVACQDGAFLIVGASWRDEDREPHWDYKPPRRLAGPQRVRPEKAAICFYGQKPANFTKIPRGFLDWLKTIPPGEQLRLYTLAGNPMMVRLANGENIHVVFEHRGQFPHDAVPGNHIALTAKAHLCDLNGATITTDMLALRLMKPSGAALTYVLASTRQLALHVAAHLRGV